MADIDPGKKSKKVQQDSKGSQVLAIAKLDPLAKKPPSQAPVFNNNNLGFSRNTSSTGIKSCYKGLLLTYF